MTFQLIPPKGGGSTILIIDYLEIAAHRFAMLAMTGGNIESFDRDQDMYRTPTNNIGTIKE